MADVYTSEQDERTIDDVLRQGFGVVPSPSNWPKYIVLRLALAKSLLIDTKPDEAYDDVDRKGGSEYVLEQITGLAKNEDNSGSLDFNDAVCGMLSVYHQEDFFSNEKAYKTQLQRHIRRGLYEIRSSWKTSHDFAAWMKDELFAEGVLIQNEGFSDASEAEKLVAAMTEIGIRANIQTVKEGSRITRYELMLPEVQSFDLLKRGIDKLGFLLGLGNEGVFIQPTGEPKVVALDLPRPKSRWKTIPASRLLTWVNQTHKETLPAWLGEDVLGNDFSFDLVDAPHLLLAGTTGSGKSITLHAVLLSMLYTKSPDELKLALIDPKLVELGQYQGIPHQYGSDIAHMASEAILMLNELVAEMEQRNQLFGELGVSNLKEANEQHRLNLPRIVIVVEELADLIMQDKEIETPLIRLAQKARSTGIHLILATQRPDSSTFSGLLRSNIPGRIALRVQKSSESKIILDETGAEKLLGVGDMLVKVSNIPVTRVHGAYITSDDIKQLTHRY